MFSAEIQNLDTVIKQLEDYKASITLKERQLLDRLEFLGATRVRVRFAEAIYTDDKDITISTTNNGKEVVISASGKDVCFIEFGAGVTHGYGYQGNKPEGIVPIGEYGKGKGKNPKGWYFTGKDGNSHHTYGNPPSMAMFKTSVELAEAILPIVKEVFR